MDEHNVYGCFLQDPKHRKAKYMIASPPIYHQKPTREGAAYAS